MTLFPNSLKVLAAFKIQDCTMQVMLMAGKTPRTAAEREKLGADTMTDNARAGANDAFLGIAFANFRLSVIDESYSFLDFLSLDSAGFIFSKRAMPSVTFAELEPPLVMEGIIKGVTVWAYMSLSKSGSLMKDIAGQMPETRAGFKLSLGIDSPMTIILICFIEGLFPLVTGGGGKPLISLGGRSLPAPAAFGPCYPFSLEMQMVNSLFTLKLELCLELGVPSYDGKPIQISGN